jgi:hypothetical protein
VSSLLLPTDTPDDASDEEDGSLDLLFSETIATVGWDLLGAPAEGDGEEEDDWLGCGGLMEELRREQMSAKKRLDMDEADGEVASGGGGGGQG